MINPRPDPRLLGWLRANDLEPNVIPIDASIAVDYDGKTITTTVLAMDANGKPFRHPKHGPLTKDITVPLKVAWEDYPGDEPPKENPDALPD